MGEMNIVNKEHREGKDRRRKNKDLGKERIRRRGGEEGTKGGGEEDGWLTNLKVPSINLIPLADWRNIIKQSQSEDIFLPD